MKGTLLELDARSLRVVLRRKLALIEFSEPWCAPCQLQLPILEEVARRVAGRATVGRVSVDEIQKVAARHGIQSLPTLVLFKRGKVAGQFVGRHSSASLILAIAEAAR